MNYTIAQTLSSEHFKRRFGIHRATFKQIVKALKPEWRATPKPGAKPKLELENRVLVALEYWREDRTYFPIGSSWGISEATVCRILGRRPVDALRLFPTAGEEAISPGLWSSNRRGH